MKIDEVLLSKLEKLSLLNLSSEEKAAIIPEMNKMLEMVDKLQEVDTNGVEPLRQVNEVTNNRRVDEVRGMVGRKEALKNAPDKNDQFFKVPKVIK